MLHIVLLLLTASPKWFCGQVDTQYQIIHEFLAQMGNSSIQINHLKSIVADYWEKNHHHCFGHLESVLQVR